MSVAKEFEAANANYVASFTKGDLQLPPQRYVVCHSSHTSHMLYSVYLIMFDQKSSSRCLHGCSPWCVIMALLVLLRVLIDIDPARALGLEEGDAHVIRNAGGRVSDALRSIIISQQLLGTREIVIVHHVSIFDPMLVRMLMLIINNLF